MRAQLALPLVALLAGCPDRQISGVSVEQGTVDVKDIPAVPRRDVDILFLIDDSLSMKEEQASLKANFSRFITVLESLDGGLPNIHIGVTTPNLGTSAIDGSHGMNIGTCIGDGDGGRMRKLPGGGAFISDFDDGHGGRTRNYTGTLTEAFAQIAEVGSNGCGIEQHLEAVKRALDNNPANAGFLRPNAYLAVILVADEDDCSLAKSTLFDGNANDPAYGDRVNFKCTHEGIECDSPNTDLGQLGRRQDCHPKYDSTVVTQIDRYVDFLKGLKTDPRDVIVAGITGDAGPFEIVKKGSVSVLKQSCVYNGPTGTQYAYPGIRMMDFLGQFANRNTRTTICNEDLSGGMTQIGELLKRAVADPCFERQLADADPTVDGVQYDCTVVDTQYRPNQPDEELRVVPACDATKSRIPCWRIEEDVVHCGYTKIDPHLKLVVERGGDIPAPDIHIRASCVTVPSTTGPQF
ncbi:hypothetical protein BH11MYX3_BH11MYX3_06830 [soil metagenome]